MEEICQACLPAADEISEVEIQERKADIEVGKIRNLSAYKFSKIS